MNFQSPDNRQPNSGEQKGADNLKEISEIQAEIKELEAELKALKSKGYTFNHPEYWPNMGAINRVGGQISHLEQKLDFKKDKHRLETEQDPERKSKIQKIMGLKLDISRTRYPGERLDSVGSEAIKRSESEIAALEAELSEDASKAETKDHEATQNAKFAELYQEIKNMKQIKSPSTGFELSAEQVILSIENVRKNNLPINTVTRAGDIRKKVMEILSL